jgi:hypothetical protein
MRSFASLMDFVAPVAWRSEEGAQQKALGQCSMQDGRESGQKTRPSGPRAILITD